MTGDIATRARPARRPFLLSGLVRCGVCGGGYTAQGANRLACANYREKGPTACTNRRHVNRRDVERRVLDGLHDRLLSPEAVAAYVRAYHQEYDRALAELRETRRPIERRLAEVERAIGRAVDAIVSGDGTIAALGDRLKALEAEKDQLLQQLAAANADPATQTAVTRLHPAAGETYVRRIRAARAAMEEGREGLEPDRDRALIENLRDLIQAIEIHPESNETRSPYRVTLRGDLARLLRHDDGSHVGGPLVAGGGIEPPTCGL
ncbi:MAG: zinc ribbon domain-containing protein [Caulobacteraceae bacterium]|nr:zinc ribbon domain-containing protein [Caulobacteraceae bacterium]